MNFYDLLSNALLFGGMAFMIIGAVGVIRLPDLFTRMHAAGITDTMGSGLILAGLVVESGFNLVTAKLVLIGAMFYFTSPVSTYALAKAALGRGVKPILDQPNKKSLPKDTSTKE
ncbi:monovalent cation/H(+) antiporter subunit G [Magnetococcales bacterium HHB-1]